MASRDAIAIKRQKAMERIRNSTLQLADRLSIEFMPLPTTGRDPALVHAHQMEAIANVLEAVCTALPSNKAVK